jgi:hypothetical protein
MIRSKKTLLALSALVVGGLIGLAQMPGHAPVAATEQVQARQASSVAQEPISAYDSPKKLCGWPPPAGVSEAAWENACYACTSMPTTKEASVDGSTMTSHSCDGHYEFRIHVVPGKKSAPATMRPIMKGGGLGADMRPEV